MESETKRRRIKKIFKDNSVKTIIEPIKISTVHLLNYYKLIVIERTLIRKYVELQPYLTIGE